MRIYNSFGDMISEVQRDVVELGKRVKSSSFQNIENVGDEYEMKEIIGYSYRLTGWKDWHEYFSAQEVKWIKAEIKERLSKEPVNPGEAWKYRQEIWEPFINEENKFDYTYSERMFGVNPNIINELKRNPSTRQAVVPVFNVLDLFCLGGRKRIPCSLTYQLLRRDERIHIIYNMRSCDVMTHFRFDVVLALLYMMWVADSLGVGYGTLTHNIGSLHIFKKDMKGIF